MATFKTILTSLGQAKIAAAIAGGSTVNLVNMAVGDGNGNPTTPVASQTALVREVYRANLNSLTRDPNNPNYIIAELIIPTTTGGWTVREIGIFDNSNALIAVGNFPDTYKPNLAEGSARDLVIRIIMEVTQPDAVALTIDPSVVLASRQWVIDNFSIAYQIPGGTTGEILRKASNADGDFEWFDPVSGFNLVVDVVEENQTASAAQTVINLAIASTVGASVYINGIRLRANQFTVTDIDTITLSAGLVLNDKITVVQNEPNGAPAFLATANKFSEIAALGTSAQNDARTNLGITGATAVATMFQEVMKLRYPIGEIFTTRRTGNPNTLLGFGTWVAYAEGRTLVGFNSGDSDFNAVDKIGGTKTHQLLAAELPSHTHTITPPPTNTSSSGSHTHSASPTGASTGGAGAHNHDNAGYDQLVRVTGGGTPATLDSTPNEIDCTSSLPLQAVGDHTHSVSIPTFNTDASGTHQHTVTFSPFASGSVGSGQGHNNLQPYIVVYYWRRSA